jgi:hypothetical protein
MLPLTSSATAVAPVPDDKVTTLEYVPSRA